MPTLYSVITMLSLNAINIVLLTNILMTFWANTSCAPNILLIVIDDLRPALSSYGDPIAITPNMDQIAENGFIFDNAFAQQALCGPSRTSLLTSRRPDTLHLYDVHSYWRQSVANFTSLPQYLKQFGYFTQSVGKVFHPGMCVVSNHSDDYPISWSVPAFHGSTEQYKSSAVCPSVDGTLNANIVCPVDVDSQPEQTLPDIQSTQFAVNFIKNYNTSQGMPFLLALGFHKPHIPLKYPKQYLDLYPLESISLAEDRYLPKNFVEVAWNPWMDLRSRHDIKQLNITFPFGVIPDYYQRYIRQSYYGCVSYVDDLIGRVLQTLEDKRLANETIVMLIGDHGWSLGEHNEWSKYSNFDVSLRIPLMVSVPKSSTSFKHINPFEKALMKRKSRAKRIAQMVELVDVFPTLCDLAGLPVPDICMENMTQIVCSEGVSLKPLIFNERKRRQKWKSFAFSQYPRPSASPQPNSDQPALKDIKIMGYSMRNSYLRYTEWIGFEAANFTKDWSKVLGRELYWGSKEDINRAYEQRYAILVKYLSSILRKGWRHQL